MSRGGFFGVRPAVVLQADGWADLSCSALGAWIRLRASAELTEQPVSDRATRRLGVTADDLETLRAAGLLEETPAGILAVGMPGPAKNPSDDPERIKARVAAHRARLAAARTGQKEKPRTSKKETTPLHLTPLQSNEVTTVTALHAPEGSKSDVTESDPRSDGSESDGRAVAAPRVRSEGVSLPPNEALRLAMAYNAELESGVSR